MHFLILPFNISTFFSLSNPVLKIPFKYPPHVFVVPLSPGEALIVKYLSQY